MFKSWIYPQIVFSARIHLSWCARGYDAALLNMIANAKSHKGLWQDVASRKTKEDMCQIIPARASGPG